MMLQCSTNLAGSAENELELDEAKSVCKTFCIIEEHSYDRRLAFVEALEPFLGQGSHGKIEFQTSSQ